LTTLLTAREVQDLLDVDKSTVYRMASDGRLPAVKVGRQWRFPAEALRSRFSLPPPTANGRPAAPAAGPGLAQALVELTAEALGVMMVVTDPYGSPITQVANPCPRFLALAQDPAAVAECAEEWRGLAGDRELGPQFRPGRHGFLCARALVRSGDATVAMVLAGGVAPEGEPADDLFVLDSERRRRVVAALPRLAALLSDMINGRHVPDVAALTGTNQGSPS
jgi:excisionase family DNA binding protein